MDDEDETTVENLTNDELFSIVYAVVELARVSAASDSDILRDIRDELAGYGLLKDEVNDDGK